MAANALYYPYIHIDDVNWLKVTLLLFPQVRRMVPYSPVDADSKEIEEFCKSTDNKPPLLFPANLSSPRSITAQLSLVKRIKRENDEFYHKYGEEPTRAQLSPSDLGFQVHPLKLLPQLTDTLQDTGLSWKPRKREEYDKSSVYIELNHRVGEVIMSSIAIACAQSEGLNIVGDERSGELHKCLVEQNLERIYDAWLHPEIPWAPPSATAHELFEFVVRLSCDVSVLTADQLRELGSDRAPIENLLSSLNEHAKNIPPTDRGKDREVFFKDQASKVIQEWKSDRKNIKGFLSEFLGDDLGGAYGKFAEKIADKVIAGTAGGSAAGQGSLSATVLGAGAGLVIGLIVHAGKSYSRLVERETKSPYRFLTVIESAGVRFRTDARPAQNG